MCQQRQYYFKNDVWKILAVYINIYYLYFVFENADTEKVEIFIAVKTLKNVDVAGEKSAGFIWFDTKVHLFTLIDQRLINKYINKYFY